MKDTTEKNFGYAIGQKIHIARDDVRKSKVEAIVIKVEHATNALTKYLVEYENGEREWVSKKMPKWSVGDTVFEIQRPGDYPSFGAEPPLTICKIQIVGLSLFTCSFQYLVEFPTGERKIFREADLAKKRGPLQS